MDEERIRALALRLADVHRRGEMDRVDHAVTVSTARYTDPTWLERERAFVLRREPQLVGFSGDIPERGDYLTTMVADRSVLLVRGDDGVARALVNACRHRGSAVAEGSGNAKRFACPYHNWTYASDGRLVAVPDRASFTGCDLADGLLALPLAERHGLLVAHPDPDGRADVDAFLGALGPELTHFGLDQLRRVRRRGARVACNWKLTIDAAQEGYHVRYLHGRTLAGRAGWECIDDGFGRHQRLGFASPEAAEPTFLDRTPAQLMEEMTFTHFLHPNAVLVVGTDSVILQRSAPAAVPGECDIELTTYSWGALTDDARDGAEKLFELVWKITLDEDLWVQEAAQRNFESGVDRIVFGGVEPALQRIHANWDAAVG